MTYLNTQQTLQFIQRNDRNGNGLSRNELMQGAMNSCMQMMHNMATGNQQGVMEAFQNLATATQLANNFDTLAQASGQMLPDNPMTISGLDIMKTALNDGQFGNISNYDIASQNQQNGQNQWGPCFGNQNLNNFYGTEISGMNQPQMFNMNMLQPSQGFNNSYYNQLSGYESGQQTESASGKGALGGLLAGAGLALATGGAALPIMAVGALVGSGIAGNVLDGAGQLQQKLGQGMKQVGNMMEMPFQAAGNLLGKIPVIGGLLKGATNIAGKIFSAPMKLTGAITEIGGKILSGVGKAVNKVGNFLKKL